MNLNNRLRRDDVASLRTRFRLQDNEVEELAASSRMVSNMQPRVGEPGAMVSKGRVTEKWGERRWKVMLVNSRFPPLAKEPMAAVISFCQSRRVLMTKGPACSNPQEVRRSGGLWPLRAHQRKFCTCMEKAGGKSRSA